MLSVCHAGVTKIKDRKPILKLNELKTAIDRAVEYAGDCDPDVEVWYK
jgi:hypothetical protein